MQKRKCVIIGIERGGRSYGLYNRRDTQKD